MLKYSMESLAGWDLTHIFERMMHDTHVNVTETPHTLSMFLS